jgi:nicotinamide mononucleotide adenylyltransferase
LLRRETPHFGAVSETERTSATQDPPVTVAEAFWMDAVEKTLLVASIDAVDGNCAAALWARHVTQPEPQVFTSAPLPAAWQARATHAVHALPKYQQIAKAYATKLREMFPDDAERELQAKDWEAFDGMKPTYTFWQYGGRQLVVF